MIKKPTYEELEKKIQALEQGEHKRQQAEKALRKNEERFLQVYQQLAVCIAQVSLEFRIEGANQAFCSMLGYREKELIGKHLREITHSDSWEENLRMQSQLVTGEIDHYRVEKRFAHKRGRVIYGTLDADLVCNSEGKPLCFLVSVLDITKQKQTHEALRKTAEALQLIIDCSPAAIISLDQDANVTMWNTAAEQIFGWKKEEVMGKPYPAVPEDKKEEFRILLMQQLNGTGLTGEVLLRQRKDGSQFYVSASTGPLRDTNGEIIGLLSIMNDITERKHAEDALSESEERLKIAGRIAYDLIYEWIVADDKLIWFGNIDEKLGYDRNEIPNTIEGWAKLIHPEDLVRIKDAVELHRMSTASIEYEYRIQHKDGSWKYWSDKGLPVLNSKGRPYKWVGVCTDITESKEAAEAIRESEKRLQSIVNNAVVGIYQVTEEGKFLLVNPRLAQMFGFKSPEEFLASVENISQIYAKPEERPLILAKIKAGGFVDGVEIEFRNRDGQIVFTMTSVRIIEDKSKGTIYEGFMTDITDYKRAEKALRESQEKLARSKKMESLGLLAGGVAHDLNNVLSGIVGYPDLLLMDLPQNSKLRSPIETIKDSGHRAVAIIQDLLTVARGVAITKKPLNLNELVSDYLDSPEFKKLEQFHPTVTVKTDLDNELFHINGSHVHVRKVVMNLMSNASEAIVGSGNVAISTMNRYIDRPLRGYDDVNIGEYVILSVSDDGPGIPSDDLERMFDPFYTKKILGRSGTGLGLTVVWNTIQDHNGYIDVASDENGTTFKCYFPVTREEITDEALSISIDDIKGKGETILVVDDEESQRDISCKMLYTLGYKTKAVASGEEAVEYLKDHTVDLILLDMIMDPGINGRETYERIIKIHVNQKALIVSGFAETEDVKEAQKLGAGKFIKKPLMLERMGLAVKEELEK